MDSCGGGGLWATVTRNVVQQLNPASESSLTLFAVVTVPAGGVVSTVQADAAAFAARQFVQLIVEATLASVQIAIAGWRKRGKERRKRLMSH